MRLFVLFFLLMPSFAFAYVDPGSGMIVWQGLIALVGAVIVFIRNPKDAIKRLIDKFRKDK